MPTTATTHVQPPVELQYETLSPLRRALKRAVVNPLANYLPAGLVRALLRLARSELAAANWRDPGGWQSMVISYDGKCRQVADRLLVAAGTMPMALRNRRRLGAYLIARLIEQAGAKSAHVLCLGAGPGQIVMWAMRQARADCHATLVDLSADAFAYGREMAGRLGLEQRVRFVQADIRELRDFLDEPADVVKMLGICEYLSDEQVVAIASGAGQVMPRAAPIVFNSLSAAHGTDRFFRRVFGLHMIHRSPERIMELMQRAGFGDFAVHAEPLGVYHVIVGRKLRPGHQVQPV